MLIILIFLLYVFLRLDALSLSGFFGAVLMGVVLIMLTNLSYLALLAIFFILCSIISKLIKKKYFISTKGSKRDVVQVYANGGIALLICLYDYFHPSSLNILLFSSSVAAAMSDTWATEFGKLSKSKPRSIGGNCGISTLGPSFTIVVVEIFTTDGDSFSTSSANESGRWAADRPNETNKIVNATAKDTTRSLRK